ncbi:IS1634 family transposase, partial [Iamia sp.]|uniref:IS1634 family transposase n=1 Tax=Iamia sp. TaxID=2722710 RepID=UPI002D117CD9|nr:hypothetical protein [Iamia sp.]
MHRRVPPTVRTDTRPATFTGSRGDQLAARLDLPDGEPLAFALFAHCFTCSKDLAAATRISRGLADRGFGVLRFDFTGLGSSEGEFANTDFSSNIQDLVLAAANRAAMDHINRNGGRFVTVLPRSRKEDAEFRDWLCGHDPDWAEAHRRAGRRHDEVDEVWHTTTARSPSAEGYRVIWVRSSTKIDRDAEARRARIAKGIAALDDLNQRLASPKARIRTVAAVEAAATAAVDSAGATRWVGFTVTETTEETFRQEKRGRPGANTRYRRLTRTHHRVAWHVKENIVARDAASDGCFPLITNDTTITPAEVLAAYRYQPNLERRNHMLKGPQEVAPVYLKTPHRIEALLLCQFLALLTEALIERQIRTAMKAAELANIPLYPELRACPAPSAPRVLDIFTSVARHHLIDHG